MLTLTLAHNCLLHLSLKSERCQGDVAQYNSHLWQSHSSSISEPGNKPRRWNCIIHACNFQVLNCMHSAERDRYKEMIQDSDNSDTISTDVYATESVWFQSHYSSYYMSILWQRMPSYWHISGTTYSSVWEKLQNSQKTINEMAVSTYVLIITLHVND